MERMTRGLYKGYFAVSIAELLTADLTPYELHHLSVNLKKFIDPVAGRTMVVVDGERAYVRPGLVKEIAINRIIIAAQSAGRQASRVLTHGHDDPVFTFFASAAEQRSAVIQQAIEDYHNA